MNVAKSNRGTPVLQVDDYEYVMHQERKQFWVWRCRRYLQNRCRARIWTDFNYQEFKRSTCGHTHEASANSSKLTRLIMKMKEEAIMEPDLSAKEVIQRTCQDLTPEMKATLPPRSSLIKTLLLARDKGRIAVGEMEQFVLHGQILPLEAKKSEIVIFGDPRKTRGLQEYRDWYITGGSVDFKDFKYLMSFYIQMGMEFYPVTHVLMHSKSKEMYMEAIKAVKSLVPTAVPQMIMVDCDIIDVECFGQCFPEAEIRISFFVMYPMLVDKALEVGLEEKMQNDKPFMAWFKCFTVLALVPKKAVADVFNALKASFLMEYPGDETEDFVLFVEETFIHGPIHRRVRRPKFEPSLWNHFASAWNGKLEIIKWNNNFFQILSSKTGLHALMTQMTCQLRQLATLTSKSIKTSNPTQETSLTIKRLQEHTKSYSSGNRDYITHLRVISQTLYPGATDQDDTIAGLDDTEEEENGEDEATEEAGVGELDFAIDDDAQGMELQEHLQDMPSSMDGFSQIVLVNAEAQHNNDDIIDLGNI